jgi:propane monooxygenase small subunit
MATDTDAPVKERSVPKPVFTDAEAGAREFPSSNSRTYNYYKPAKRRATIYEDVTVDVQPDPERYLLQGWIYGFADGIGGYPLDWTALKSTATTPTWCGRSARTWPTPRRPGRLRDGTPVGSRSSSAT